MGHLVDVVAVRMMNQPWSSGSSSAVAASQGHVEDVEDELGPASLDLRGLLGRDSGPLTGIHLGLADPGPQVSVAPIPSSAATALIAGHSVG
jgi:hypothetical protein